MPCGCGKQGKLPHNFPKNLNGNRSRNVLWQLRCTYNGWQPDFRTALCRWHSHLFSHHRGTRTCNTSLYSSLSVAFSFQLVTAIVCSSAKILFTVCYLQLFTLAYNYRKDFNGLLLMKSKYWTGFPGSSSKWILIVHCEVLQGQKKQQQRYYLFIDFLVYLVDFFHLTPLFTQFSPFCYHTFSLYVQATKKRK